MKNDLKSMIITRDEAARLLLESGVGVIPTDTVYGLAALATDPSAVKRLYALKSRERKPGTVVAASVEQVRSLGVEQALLDRVGRFWPNPLSVILLLPPDKSYLDQGLGDIAIRVVDDEALRGLLMQTGPLLTSSANLPGEPVSETVEEAWDYFGTSVDFYVDGGKLTGRLSSTLIKFDSSGVMHVLREGAFPVDRLPRV